MKHLLTGFLCWIAINFTVTAQENALIVNNWQIKAVEEFGAEYDPEEQQANDWINFMADKTFEASFENQSLSGTWSEKNGTVTLIPGKNSDFEVNWMRVESLEKERLAIKFQIPSLVKTTYIFVPKE